MHAVITSIACNPQPASLAPTMDALLRVGASGEYGSDTRTDFLQPGLKHEKLMFVTSHFLDLNFSSNIRLEWQAQHSPILLSPDSIASMLRSRYPVFSLPAMHSLEANEGRSSEEAEEEVEGNRYEEGDELPLGGCENCFCSGRWSRDGGYLNWCHNRWQSRRRSRC